MNIKEIDLKLKELNDRTEIWKLQYKTISDEQKKVNVEYSNMLRDVEVAMEKESKYIKHLEQSKQKLIDDASKKKYPEYKNSILNGIITENEYLCLINRLKDNDPYAYEVLREIIKMNASKTNKSDSTKIFILFD